jgi:arylsulfatase
MKRRDFLKNCFASLAGLSTVGLLVSCSRQSYRKRYTKKPNVLLIMADDMGYSDAECYGGEVGTPNLNKLAANGLRFTQHYSTGRCWPSRACILTGYYAQQIRRDSMEGVERGDRPSWARLLPEMLKPYGYMSYHSGKWHIDGTQQAGGFDRAWGSHMVGRQCDWDRFFDSGRWQEDEFSAPVDEGGQYYSTVAIADHAIACLKLHEKNVPDKPFFQYVAFYSPHFPLHAMQKDIDKYRDTYLQGWDVIRQRRWRKMKKVGLVNCALSDKARDIVPHWNLGADKLKELIGEGEAARAVDWERLTDEQQKFQATKMAIHAAMIDRMDAEIGRIIDQLKAMGEFENTLIMFASDNGASAEQIIRGDKHDKEAAMGSAESYLCLGPGWSTAANTPFKLHKHWNHEGGISSPFIVHWPAGIKDRGKLRHDPSHFIDVVPTVLEVSSGKRDLQNYESDDAPGRPGLSLIPAFAKNGAVKHENLWWCHHGNRAIRMGDWKLSANGSGKEEYAKWELYNLKTDRSEMNDLALKYPDKVKELDQRWNQIAEDFREGLKRNEQTKP